MTSTSQQFVFKPHGRPRDEVDYVVALLAMIPALGELYGVPGLIIYVVTGSPLLSLIGAVFGGAVLVLFVVPLFTVRQLTVDVDGLYFQRVLGSPKILPWSRVKRIRRASRVEVVLWGWLLPPFPQRDATRCMSSRDQFRIEWGRRYCFFPPQDADEFVRIVARWYALDGAPEALTRQPDPTPSNSELPTAIETGNPYQPPQTMN